VEEAEAAWAAAQRQRSNAQAAEKIFLLPEKSILVRVKDM
jgi:hypothetical protein